MATEINAITLALTWLAVQNHTRVVFVSTLEKIRRKNLHADWTPIIHRSCIAKITWIYCPGHSGVSGNEAADKLAGNAPIEANDVLFDPQTVVRMVETSLCNKNDETSSSDTLLSLISTIRYYKIFK